MHDVIIDSRKNTTDKKSQKSKTKPKTSVKFMSKSMLKSFIVAGLLSINFLLFVNTGAFQVFEQFNLIAEEVIYIEIVIFFVSFLLIYILSFSQLLQILLISIVFTFLTFAFINQFGLFDKELTIKALMKTYSFGLIDQSPKESILIFKLLLTITSFITLSMFNKKTLSKLTIFIYILIVILIVNIYINKKDNLNHVVTHDQKTISSQTDGKKFIYIAMPELSSYHTLKKLKINTNSQKALNNEIDKTTGTMLGFYAKNNFVLYPLAYINSMSMNTNIVQMLNPTSKNKNTNLNSFSNNYWNFKKTNNSLFPRENKLFDVFSKSKYEISSYQSSELNLCIKNGDVSVDKCVEKKKLPINNKLLKATNIQKTLILATEWIDSSNFFNNSSTLYNISKLMNSTNKLPMLDYPAKNLQAVDGFALLNTLTTDVINDNGNQAYFLQLDAPGKAYVYDEYCQIKPIKDWKMLNKPDWVINNDLLATITSYNHQVSCVFGKLQEFIDILEKNDKLKNTVIVLHGASPLIDIYPTNTQTFLEDFVENNSITFAILDPLKKDFNQDNKVCSASQILKKYLFKNKTCPELKEFNLPKITNQKMLKQLKKIKITDDEIQIAKTDFSNWYNEWLKINNPELLNKESNKKIIEDITDNETISKVDVIEKPIILEKEVEIKSFNEAINEKKAEELQERNLLMKQAKSSANTNDIEVIEIIEEDVDEADNINLDALENIDIDKIEEKEIEVISIEDIKKEINNAEPINLIPLTK